MKKNLFRLFALIVMASMFFGCKDSDNTPQDDPSKTIVTERDDCYDDGISYDGSIAILSKSHVDNIDEAAALRFLAGVTTEVTDNTVAAIVEGNPTDFVFDIGFLLDNGGAVFFYEPKASELKELVNHEYNILPLDEETIDAYDFDKIAVFGMTLDGDVYTCRKSEVEALEYPVRSQVEIVLVDDGDERDGGSAGGEAVFAVAYGTDGDAGVGIAGKAVRHHVVHLGIHHSTAELSQIHINLVACCYSTCVIC